MKTFWVVVCLLLASLQVFAQARKSDGKVRVAVVGDRLVSRLDKGFHFNKDAPASLKTEDGQTNLSPDKKTEEEISFKTGQVEKKNFTVNFYVCDDAKTVCEEHTKKFVDNREVTEGVAVNTNTKVAAKNNAEKSTSSSSTAKLHNGFIEDSYATAVSKARAEKKLILVDFRAPWCPACIRLETEVFPQATFQKATESLVKLSINIDRDENKELAQKYAVKAIPTLVILDADGNEIYRSLDYKPTAQLSAELSKIINSKPITYASLKLEAEAGSKKAMLALGQQAYMSLNYAEAVKWLSPLKEERRLFANAEVNYWNEQVESDKKALRTYTDTLEKWIAEFPKTYEAITWRNELAEKLKKPDQSLHTGVQKLLETNVVIIKSTLVSQQHLKSFFNKNYIGDFSNFEKVELNTQLATSYRLLKNTAAASEAQKLALVELSKMKLTVKRPGELLMAISYLRQLESKTEAQAWLEKLVQTYPSTYVYYSKLARFYFNEKDYTKALPLAQKAVELDQSIALRNLQFLAEVQKSLNQKKEAMQTVTRALALPEAKFAHNKKLTDSLTNLKKTLE